MSDLDKVADGQLLRHVVVDETGQVVNTVIWDGTAPWRPGEALAVMPELDLAAVPEDKRADAAIAKWEAETGLTAKRDGKAAALDAAEVLVAAVGKP